MREAGIMKNLFYLPTDISVEKAKSLWQELDATKHGSVVLSYIDEDYNDVKTTDRSLRDVLAKVAHSTTIILWSVRQIDFPMKDFSALLMRQKNRYVTVRILNPDFSLDPDVPECYAVMAMMEAMQGISYNQEKRTHSGFGYKKIEQEIIDGLRKDKKEGLSLKELSRKYDVAVTTVCKYTRGIQPIVREQKREVKKRYQPGFNFDLLQNVPIEQQSRIRETVVEFLKSQRTYETRRNYFLDLQKFFNWVYAKKTIKMEDPDQITFEIGSYYLEWLQNTGFRKSVVRRYFSTLNTYLNYCLKRGYVRINHISAIKSPKIPRHKVETEILEPSELKRVLSHAMMQVRGTSVPDRKTIAHRNFVGIYLLATVGMRVGSLLGIRLQDIRDRGGQTFLTMQAKGDDEYSVCLDPVTTKVLKAFIDLYFADKPEDSYIMFSRVNDMSGPMTSAALGMALKKIVQSCGLRNKKITAHSFRATVATEGYKAGLTLKEIQMRLNHKKIEQTSAYIKWAEKATDATWVPDLGEEFELLTEGRG